MSQRRLLAFVSSRMAELAPERKIIKAELDKLHVDAWVFETDAGARAQSVQQTYLKEVEAADLYIGVFWTGYGEYTIEEFDHAHKLGRSCLVYDKRSNQELRDPRLTDFLKKIGEVKGLVTIQRFETPEELGEFVKRDVAAWQTDIVRKVGARGYAAPFQAPALGDQYVERVGLLDHLTETLLALDEDGEPRITRAALHGMGGSGKTSIATGFAHLDAVRKRFPDGVLFTTLGQNPDVKQRLSDWGHALHDPELPSTGYIDETSGTSRLRTLLSDKACLLIVDDVWEGDHARAFVVGGTRCLMLITTRLSEIGEEIEALTIELAKMTPVEALELVEKRSGAVAEADREHAAWLMEEVEYLPLALELISAQARKHGWEDYRRRWTSQKLKAVKRGRTASGRYDNLWDSLELSVEELSDEDQEQYFRLGVFQEDTSFPASACARLWQCSDDDAAEILIDFAGRALLHEQRELKPRLYSFHDVLYEFVLDRLGDERRQGAHRMLVAGYRSLCNGEWHKVPDDGYFFDHFTEHLKAAGFADELYKLINRDWMDAQFRQVRSHRAFAADLGRIAEVGRAETPPNVFQIIQSTVVSATLGSLATRSDPEALAALAHIGEIDTALGHAELIQDPDRKSRAYRLIAEALFDRGASSGIQQVLQEALKAANSVNLSHIRCPALCDLAETIFKLGDVELARQVASDAESTARVIVSEYYASRLMVAAACTQARVGNIEQGKAAALDALRLVESEKDSVLKLAHLLKLHAPFETSEDHERADQILKQWTDLFDEVNNKIKFDSFIYLGYADQLSEAFLEVDNSESAVDIAEKWIGQSWEAADALARAANGLITSGAIERGTEVADKAVKMVREQLKGKQYSHGAPRRISAFGSVAAVLGRIGREDEAVLLTDAALDAEGKSHSLGTLALTLAQRNAVDSARHAANASLTASQQLIQNTSSQASWLCAIAKSLHDIGKNTEATQVAKRALSLIQNWTSDDWREAREIMPLAGILARLGEQAKARWLIEQCPDNQLQAEGWLLIIRSPDSTAEDRIDLAHRAIDAAENWTTAIKPILLAQTAMALAEVGLDNEAFRIAKLAISVAPLIEDPNRAPGEALCYAAHALARIRQFDQARQTIDSVTVRGNENPSRVMSLRVNALSTLANALEDAGEHDWAIATASFAQELILQDDSLNFEALNFQAEALIAVGETLTRLKNADEAKQVHRRALKLALARLSPGEVQSDV